MNNRSIQSEIIGPSQKILARAHPEVQNIEESQKERSGIGKRKRTPSASSQRTLRYNDFELVQKPDPFTEVTLEIEPADSVSNHQVV